MLLDEDVTAPLVDKLLTDDQEPEEEDGTAKVPPTPLASPVEIFAALGATGIPVEPATGPTITLPPVLDAMVGICPAVRVMP